MKRYDIDSVDKHPMLVERDSGRMVLADDAIAELAARDATIAELREAVRVLAERLHGFLRFNHCQHRLTNPIAAAAIEAAKKEANQ